MTIDDFKEKVIPRLDGIDGVLNAVLDDYNSYSLSLVVYPEEKANLKSVTPAIKRTLKAIGINDGFIEEWSSPSPRDSFGDREQEYYMIDIAYDDAPLKNELPDEAKEKEVLVYSRNYEGAPYYNKKLEEIFLNTYNSKNFVGPHQHAAYIEEHSLNREYDVVPLYIYRHSGEIYELSPRCRFDSAVNGVQ